MSKREVLKDRIVETFRRAFHDRSPTMGVDLITQISVDLEESCYLATHFGHSEERLKAFSQYLVVCATFIAHLSPHFYTARHSFIYRDILFRNQLRDPSGEITDPINIALQDIRYLWPEIFENPYLLPKDAQIVMETREVEIALVHTLLDEMARKGTQAPNFETDLSKSLQTVCMGKGQQCWNRSETKVIIPCGDNDASCNFERSSYCMPYEDFLVHFASNDMQGDVEDPVHPGQQLAPLIAQKIRRVWFKELLMARVYLDLTSPLEESVE